MALPIISTGAAKAEFPATASMFVRYAADATENTSVTVNQTFATTDVDTTNNQIALPDSLNFAAPTTITSPGGVPVFFSSTDTLPAPLEIDTPYILSRVSVGNFRVFPVTDGSNVFFSDDFNRADEDLENSPNWTRVGGAANQAFVSNNQLGVDTTQTAYLAPDVGSADHFVEVAWLGLAEEAFVCCRLTDISNFVGWRYRIVGVGRIDMFKRVAGTFTLLNSVDITLAGGEVVRLECVGDTARCLVDDVEIIAPASLAGSHAGVTRVGIVPGITAQDPFIDDFETGAALQPGALLEETPLFAQDYMQQSNPIVLTDQGSGVHTVFTDPLVNQVADLTGNGYVLDVPDANDRNRWLHSPNDASGRPVFRARLLARAQTGSAFAIHGNGYPQGGDRLAARQEVEGARTVWHTYVARLTNTDINNLAKTQPDSVNTTTGVITATGESNSHPFSGIGGISDRVRVAPVAGSLPDGLAEDTDYWVDRVTSTTFTLHTTEADADAGTNPIVPTTSPALGDWMVWAPEKPGDIERARFFTEQLDPASGGNTLSPRTAVDSSNFGQTQVIADDFVVSGSGNGRVGTPGRDLRELGEAGEVSVWFPAAATRPVRNDTSVALANGTYWISLDPQSSVFYRLHDTQQSAISAQGVNTIDCECIKYDGTVGSGFVRIEASGEWPVQVGVIDNTPTFPDFRFPLDELGVVTFKVDYLPDDPATTPRITILFNGEVVADYDGPGTKGLLGTAVDDGSRAWMFMNSPQGHTPFEGDIYDAAFGASTGVVDNADLLAQHTWAIDKYINPSAASEGAVSKPVDFAVGGTKRTAKKDARTQTLADPEELKGGERTSPSSGVRRLSGGPASSFTTRTSKRGFD